MFIAVSTRVFAQNKVSLAAEGRIRYNQYKPVFTRKKPLLSVCI